VSVKKRDKRFLILLSEKRERKRESSQRENIDWRAKHRYYLENIDDIDVSIEVSPPPEQQHSKFKAQFVEHGKMRGCHRVQ